MDIFILDTDWYTYDIIHTACCYIHVCVVVYNTAIMVDIYVTSL